MPFIGQDWRSPGDQWVRTAEGWETMRLWRVKVFENLNENAVARINRLAQDDFNHTRETTMKRQSFIMYCSGSSKEKKEFTSFSEAIVRLDMAGAVRDINRANYMTKLLSIVLKKLPDLSGTSQKLVLGILEIMVNEAIKTESNMSLMKDMLICAHNLLKDRKHCHIGSHGLWLKHMQTVDQLTETLANTKIKEINTDGKIKLSDLPTDCLRLILAQVSDHRDVFHAGQTSLIMNEVTEEMYLWKKMCIYHFSDQQIMTFLPFGKNENTVDWKYIYRRCFQRFGKKDDFADMLALCCLCSSIHWKNLGHPCTSDNEYKVKELSPEDFMSLLKL